MLKFKLLATFMAATLSACTTSNVTPPAASKPTVAAAAVAKRDTATGPNRTFAASYDKTVSTARTALANQKLKITGESVQGAQTLIYFEKPISAFSWGEKGRLTVAKSGDAQTQVFVTSAKNVAINVTAKNEQAFAREIFGEMTKLLGSG